MKAGTGDSEADKAEAEALVLVGYAATMEAVQQLELALKHLAILKTELSDGIGFDDAWSRTLKLLRKAIGPLKESVPNHLAGEIDELRQIRNFLAHEALLLWRLDTAIGLAQHREVVDWLLSTEFRFRSARDSVSELAAVRMAAEGIEPEDLQISAGELRRMITEPLEGPEST